MKLLLSVGLVLLFLAAASPGFCQQSETPLDFREWKDASGQHSVVAKFVRFLSNDSVRLLRKDGREVDIPIEKLGKQERVNVGTIRDLLADQAEEKRRKLRLAQFTKGFSTLTQVIDEYVEKAPKIRNNSSLTSAKKDAELDILYGSAKSQMKGRDISLHYVIEDIISRPGGKFSIEAKEAFPSLVTTSNFSETLQYGLSSDWESLEKGDVIRVTGQIKVPCDRKYNIAIRYKEFSTTVCPRSAAVVKVADLEVLSEAKEWFAQLGKEKPEVAKVAGNSGKELTREERIHLFRKDFRDLADALVEYRQKAQAIENDGTLTSRGKHESALELRTEFREKMSGKQVSAVFRVVDVVAANAAGDFNAVSNNRSPLELKATLAAPTFIKLQYDRYVFSDHLKASREEIRKGDLVQVVLEFGGDCGSLPIKVTTGDIASNLCIVQFRKLDDEDRDILSLVQGWYRLQGQKIQPR